MRACVRTCVRVYVCTCVRVCVCVCARVCVRAARAVMRACVPTFERANALRTHDSLSAYTYVRSRASCKQTRLNTVFVLRQNTLE